MSAWNIITTKCTRCEQEMLPLQVSMKSTGDEIRLEAKCGHCGYQFEEFVTFPELQERCRLGEIRYFEINESIDLATLHLSGDTKH